MCFSLIYMSFVPLFRTPWIFLRRHSETEKGAGPGEGGPLKRGGCRGERKTKTPRF